MRHEIEQVVIEWLQTTTITKDIGRGLFVVERPSVIEHGDYSTNAALVAAPFLKKNPKDVAIDLKTYVSGKIQGVDKVEIAGPGFVNFFLSPEMVATKIAKAADDNSWGANTIYADRTVMVEYTQPNPFKPFHIGHLMSNTIGESLVHLFRRSGARVVPVNYQGDVGLHIAKALWGLQKKGYDAENIANIAEAYVFGNTAYEDDAAARTEIVAINKQVYASDPAIMPLYTRGREVTLAHFEDLYRMLGTKFEHYFFESEVWRMGEALVREGLKKGIFKESDGAIIFPGEDYGLHTRVFINSQGLPTYEAKDLGLAIAKLAYVPFNLSITVTAVEQKEYFKVVFEALAQLRPELRGLFVSVTHGMMRFAEGKMSSRKGNVITGESLLADLESAARDKVGERELANADSVAKQVAVGAIKYAVLKQGSTKDIIFDAERSLSLEGDSGPYLQYARVRASSLIKKIDEIGKTVETILPNKEFEVFIGSLRLSHMLIHFPDVVERAVIDLEPHYVTTYLTELASEFNSWYVSPEGRVIGGQYPLSYGHTVARAVERTLTSGLSLLGIPTPEEM